tara:strand:- start:58 stop:1032 length:975 start_codon:yes stop_codon:yes gene_type:complete
MVNKPRNCKIIATYFGMRRTYPYNYQNTIKILKDSIQNELELDPGVDNLDVIIVNHNCDVKEANDFLDSIDGKKTFAGKIRVFHAPWNNGVGMSLGSMDYGFKKVRDEYDYFFFQEDDYKVPKKDYYKKGIEILNQKEVGFVGYDMLSIKNHSQAIGEKYLKYIFRLPIILWGYKDYLQQHDIVIDKIIKLRKANQFPYAGGLMGLTHKKYLDQIIEMNGKLSYPEIPNPRHTKKFIEFEKKSLWSMVKTFFIYNHYFVWYWLYCVLGEVEFTRIYYDFGYKVTHFPDTKNLVYSYKIARFKTSDNEKLYLIEDLFTDLKKVDK